MKKRADGAVNLDWEDLVEFGAPWDAPMDLWQALGGLTGGVAGAALLSKFPVAGACSGATIGLLAARVARLRSRVPAHRIFSAALLGIVVGWSIHLGLTALTGTYRWDLRSPSFGQAAVATMLGRGVAGVAVLLIPALLQANTRRWIPAVLFGGAGGLLGAWLCWPVIPPPSDGSGVLLAPAFWVGLVLAAASLGEQLYARLPDARWTYRVTLWVVGALALALAPLASAFHEPLIAQYPCSGVRVYSFSERWGSNEALGEVCSTLRGFPHATEWTSLNRVVLLKGVSRQALDALGTYLPSPRTGQGAVIEVYQTETANMQSMTRVLAHEYGHHFTTYHLKSKEGRDWSEFRGSRWAHLRGIDQLPGVGEPVGPYAVRASEIAAEDYAVLFGGAAGPMEVFQAPWTQSGIPPITDRPEVRLYWEGVMSGP